MNTFFEEENVLNIDELIMNQPSFQKIMEDGIVTDAEIKEQGERVISCLKEIEKIASAEVIDKVRDLLTEISVLVAISKMRG